MIFSNLSFSCKYLPIFILFSDCIDLKVSVKNAYSAFSLMYYVKRGSIADIKLKLCVCVLLCKIAVCIATEKTVMIINKCIAFCN